MPSPDAATETESERDGFLSYSKEWHALAVGLAAGLIAGRTQRWEIAAGVVAISLGTRAAGGPLKQLKREPWYAVGGMVLGVAAGLSLRAYGHFYA